MNIYKNNFNNLSFQYYLRDDVDFSVFNEIFKINEYKSAQDIIKNAKYPVLDVGAHVGFFSIFSTCLNRDLKVYAIEPEKNNFEYLEKNKNINNFLNIKTFKCVIGGETKNGKLFVSEDSINHRIKRVEKPKTKNQKEEDNFQNIRIFSLSDFLNDNKIEKVSLVKMDIEGGEYNIIENIDVETFLKIGAFIMEYHKESDNVRNGEDEKWLEKILRENGFSVQLFPSKFDKDLGFLLAINKRFSNE